jgi:hypothetical protein
LLIAIKPELIYHFQQLGFTSAKAFFTDYASYPGGLVEYFSIFLFQFYSKPFWGALVTTIVLSIILTIAGELLKKGNRIFNGVFMFIPVVLLAISFTDYALPPVFPIMVLSLFVFFYIFKLIAESKLSITVQLVLILFLFVIAYYISGGFIFMVLSGSSIIYLLFLNRKNGLYSAGLIIGLFLILPYLAQLVFFINIKDAYFKLVPYFSLYRPGFLLYGAIFALPFTIVIHQLISKISHPDQSEKPSFFQSDKFQAFQVVTVIAVLAIGLLLNINSSQKHRLNIDYLAQQCKWDELLKLAKNETSQDRLVQFQISRALYHTGVLTETLFDYPQFWGVDGLLLTRQFEEDILLPTTELYLDFGYVNEAIHYANEAISQNENSPVLIEQLILANIVANKYRAAKIYINELKNYLFYKKKALDYEKYVNGESIPEIDKIVLEKRKLMPVNDFLVTKKIPQDELFHLLSDRPENKMVYEYMITSFLLENDLASFFKYYPMGRNMNYKKLPTIFQQALILYQYDLSRQGKTLGNIRYDNEITSRFKEYISVLKRCNGDKEIARPLLGKDFGNTYWFYILYNSPVTNNTKIATE